MDKSDTFNQLTHLISILGVATLSRYVGKERVDRIASLGQPLDSHDLAAVLVSEYGGNVLKDKKLRANILETLSIDDLKEKFGSDTPPTRQQVNNFNWGNNERSRTFLTLFDIDPSFLPANEEDTPAFNEIQIEGPLHPYQDWIRKYLLKSLLDPAKARVIVHMPTGSGKTRTCLEAVVDFIRVDESVNPIIVWMAHSEELCEQAVEAIEAAWSKGGSQNAHILRLWGGRNIEGSPDGTPLFVVTSFQTAYRMLTTQDDAKFGLFSRIRGNCVVLVVDEAHQSIAPTYRDAIELFSGRETKIVGLTATPGRHHIGQAGEETVALADFYQKNKINIVDDEGGSLDNPVEYLRKQQILAPIDRYKLSTNVQVELSEVEQRQIERRLDIPVSVLQKLGNNANRTNLIVTQAILLASERKLSTVIFAPTKDNAIEIATVLRLKGCNARAITADSGPFERQEAIEQFKSGALPVLTNYGVLTTGFDAPNIEAVIIARPTTSVVLYSQMIGRGIRGRRMGGTDNCVLVDVVDNITNMPSVEQAFTYFDEYF